MVSMMWPAAGASGSSAPQGLEVKRTDTERLALPDLPEAVADGPQATRWVFVLATRCLWQQIASRSSEPASWFCVSGEVETAVENNVVPLVAANRRA